MTSWKVSRHPEWDLMYSAGLTAREIADLCHANIATVHLHMKTREKYEPGFNELHADALRSRGNGRPSTKWRRRAQETVEFVAKHKELPQRSGDLEELSLHNWLSRQRNLRAKGQLSRSKIEILQQLGEWYVSPQRIREITWLGRLQDLQEFVIKHDRLPRYRRYTNEQERTLGVWLHNQHQRRMRDELPESRLAALNATIPGWRSHQ